MLSLRQVTLSQGNKVLLTKASLALHEKQKIGLVGNNGCGKSSLFSLILGQLTADEGECQLNPQLRISYLSQQLPDSEETALDFVLAGDEDYFLLQQRLKEAEDARNDAQIIACHEQLSQTGGYSKPAKAAAIMDGLGFEFREQQQPVNSFSGGWRMRLSLARCLMNPADLILLDEPTNHLDMEAIFWLERWLRQSPSSIIVISHDREFLDAFVTHILHIEQQNTFLYSGDYSRFEQARAQKLALQQATYTKQQEKINHLMSFVNRFRAKATKAKQAQSRLKMIEKMEVIAQAQVDSPFSFEFFPCPKATSSLIRCEQVAAGYAADTPILEQINLIINSGARMGLLGPNGEGKSTLIKTLTGNLLPLKGEILSSAHLNIGYYAQHQLEELNPKLSPLETIQALSPTATEQSIRDFLGGFNFIGDMAVNAIHYFSGGEKARLALAKLVWQKPNLLLLDEPTNHLDLSMRSAIEIALQSYEGALILISHDRHLLRSAVDEYYLVYNKQVHPFKGDLDDYYIWLSDKTNSKKQVAQENNVNNNYKERKSLQNKLKKLEQETYNCQQRLNCLQNDLADETLYASNHSEKLQSLLKEQQKVKKLLQIAEEEWLTAASLLEEIGG
ncbi:ABC-F family ATP-binding cassette domain-containing protein [Legionella gresilensis]|uniref:ABC-F family ATP-binding cassette domain-containing protein n=1 Tax=Legionella gresilensis TaxID=91823 RepID=UPI0010414EED|nr:ATP-binding cassette domain-containing protein [Legionella gresilensis]